MIALHNIIIIFIIIIMIIVASGSPLSMKVHCKKEQCFASLYAKGSVGRSFRLIIIIIIIILIIIVRIVFFVILHSCIISLFRKRIVDRVFCLFVPSFALRTFFLSLKSNAKQRVNCLLSAEFLRFPLLSLRVFFKLLCALLPFHLFLLLVLRFVPLQVFSFADQVCVYRVKGKTFK